jgi:hypothetical protein
MIVDGQCRRTLQPAGRSRPVIAVIFFSAATPGTAPTSMIELPPAYRILPTTIPFWVPGFEQQRYPQAYTMAPEPIDCGDWFRSFVGRVQVAVGVSYLPVCRMSDGEFLLLFGFQSPSPRLPFLVRLRVRLAQARERIRQRLRGFEAQTAPGVSSGVLSPAELATMVPVLAERYAQIARDGILALHLEFGGTPFQEQFFPAVGRWLDREGITLTLRNHVPFYFVYALLRGPEFPRLVAGRRLLVVHSAEGAKREAILRSLAAAGARAVEWLPISPSRSFAEVLDLSRLRDKPDLCLLGGGVGKAALFDQLRPLGVPCLDAGFCFEVWADADKQFARPYMAPDGVFDPSRIGFGTAAERRQMVGARGTPSQSASPR